MARSLLFWILILLLPFLALVLILLARRSRTIPNLSLALILSGITGAVFTAVFTYSHSTVPIAPYPLSRSAWFPIIRICLLSLYVGFGLGGLLAGLVVFPFWLKKKLTKNDSSAQDNQKPVQAEKTQG
jgi:hypothetical protein